ncbi:MAG TPA: isoleucine--tRNA ligase [Thermomicrobiales bacterium]|nr:isoleucine--tRNA ligase [Thermomicrobiales bacterium]
MTNAPARMFREVDTRADFPAMERERLGWWYSSGVVEQYLTKNDGSGTRWSFLDGPITANNPMGVHHAWGRTYKDLWVRYHTMLGHEQRYQNGFDCQGLWVEVEVEKELGLGSKREIEEFGIDRFVNLCKERVRKYSGIQTEQTKRLGNFMDWDNSYYTMSDVNNYTIWHFLKTCHERGWIYKGDDVMPWCPRCGTGLSEMELVEGYQDRTHRSVYVEFPLVDEDAALLVWTTTPWTLTSNVAAAVRPDLDYVKIRDGGRGTGDGESAGRVLYLAREAARHALRGGYEVLAELKGAELAGRVYRGPFDELPAEQGVQHRVILWDDVAADEGTGIVHIAPGCGKEDYGLAKEQGLQIVAPIDEFGVYIDGFDWLTGMAVGDVAGPIVRNLREKDILYRDHDYTHRYPTCWRCKTDLVFRLVDEWFIDVDPMRERMQEITREIRWIPGFGEDREIDWLRNMDNWMISKKRYWGLALPIYECQSCGNFDVVGSKDELRERAVEGWVEFEGHSPHRPWVDAVKIACSQCGATISRIKDVGNPWLDAGIVPFSTMGYTEDREEWSHWFPADFITESFPGQFRNWFYSMLAQSTALVNEPPYKTVLGFALLRDEHGKEMHKSAGNAIWFDDAADKMGSDVMRWLYCSHNPTVNLNFGYHIGDEVRRRFILPLWNSYAFFANYAALDGFDPTDPANAVPLEERTLLDRWILSRLQGVVDDVRACLDDFDAQGATRALERFVVDELSNWYIRRNRRRFWKTEADRDKAAAYQTLREALVTLTMLLAPFLPFTSEEMYDNLVRSVDPEATVSVHLLDYPLADAAKVDAALDRDMAALLAAVNLGRSARNKASVKVRQPLPAALVWARDPETYAAIERMQDQLLDELNVKALGHIDDPSVYATYVIRPNLSLLGPKYGKALGGIRAALAEADPARVAATVRAGESLELVAGGEAYSLTPDELLVDVREREGFNVAEEGDLLVALDTTLTRELIHEGLARDFIRGVQDARKEAGLRVEDTIRLAWQTESGTEVAQAIDRHLEDIAAETLAREAAPGWVEAAAWEAEVKVGAEKVTIGITRIGSLLDER